jgi:hypothetical protein
MVVLKKIHLTVICLALILGIIANFPVFFGSLEEKKHGKIFLGFDFPVDYQLYASFSKDAADRNTFLLQNKHTTETQRPSYIVLPLSLIGFTAKALNLSLPFVFNAFRFFAVMFFFLVLWLFLGLYFKEEKKRIVAFIAIAFGSGLGWLVVFLSNFIPLIAKLKSTDLAFWLP